ncbi:MAG: CdaR family protein [Terriglobales bacterium]
MMSLVKRVFVQNFGLKLISLLLAVGLWVVVARSPVVEVVIKVPIEFKNVPDNLEIDSASFTEAQIRVRGPERLVNRLRSTDVSAHVDLSKVVPGTRTFELTSNVSVPQGLEVVQVLPVQFQLSFDNRMIRNVEVHPRVTGNFAQGMRVAQAIADPPSVTITGPRRRVEKVEAATTDPVDASGTMERATFVTQAYVPEPLVYVVHPTPIRVTVIMERSGEEKPSR